MPNFLLIHRNYSCDTETTTTDYYGPFFSHESANAYAEQLRDTSLDDMSIVALHGPNPLALIHQELDGTEWSADICDAIADILRRAGYTIGDSE